MGEIFPGERLKFQKFRGGLTSGEELNSYNSNFSIFLTKKNYKFSSVGLFLNFALPCSANLTVVISIRAGFSGVPCWQFSNLLKH